MRRATAIGLGWSALMALAACGGGGGGGAPPPPMLDGPQASEAVAAAALSIADALVELSGDPSGVETLGEATVGSGCMRGRLTGTCVGRHTGSTLRVTARHCELVDGTSGLRFTVDGGLVLTTPYGICDFGGLIPIDGVRTYRFRDFSVAVADDGGVIERFTAERLVETLQPRRTGCGRADATIDVNGVMTVQRPGGIDAELRASRLHLERRASVVAGTCTGTIQARGGVAIDDHAHGRTAAADLDDLTLELVAGAVRRIDGGFALPCAAPLTIATDQPLLAGDRCPQGGLLELERPHGSRGFIDFAAGGVRLDADGDGTPERVAADCHDPALAQCP